jgi:hypothetical protein
MLRPSSSFALANLIIDVCVLLYLVAPVEAPGWVSTWSSYTLNIITSGSIESFRYEPFFVTIVEFIVAIFGDPRASSDTGPTMVDTHTDAHGSISWRLEDLGYNYGRDCYQFCIEGLIQRYLQPWLVPQENAYGYLFLQLKNLTNQIWDTHSCRFNHSGDNNGG